MEVYLINPDGTNPRRLTDNAYGDAFPTLSPDGKKIVFASNRGARVRGETNIFVADWVEGSQDDAP